MVKNRSRQSGFTLIELIVVVTIIGILAGIAVVQVKYATRKALEAALMQDLHEMRKAIDDFYADKQRFPNDLNELVPNYLRKIPPDPITKAVDWEEVKNEAGDEPVTTDTSGMPQSAGIRDVKCPAPGTTLDGKPYNEL